MTLDASGSTGGGRSLFYFWKAESIFDTTKIREILNAANANTGGKPIISIPRDALQEGGTYIFILEVINFLGKKNEFQVTVTKNAAPLPQVHNNHLFGLSL